MDRPDDLEQRLWEFVYDLLPQDEAEALRRRIAAETDVARLHDEVRGKAAILAQAARLKLPPIPLAQPTAHVRASSRRWTNWAVALAASLLLCYLGFAGFRTRSLERVVAGGSSGMSWAEQPVRTVVFGPSKLQPTRANFFAVQTQTAAGAPRATAVNYRVTGDDGTLVTSGQCQSDASGFAQFNFRTAPPSNGSAPQQFQNFHLELEPQTNSRTVMARCTLPVATRELATYLSADKTIYRPGERVRCRTVTLDRADLEVVREVPVEFRILDVAGQPLDGARQEVPTQHGVAFAEFELSQFQPAGTHTLVAASPTGAFPEERRKFEVRPYVTPAVRQKQDLARDGDKLGDEVEADPADQGNLSVEFFPESGELVHDVANRVYFFAHDAQEKPVQIQGRVVDGQGREAVAVQTIHDGRGVFVFQPQRGQSYQLQLGPASGVLDRRDLPPVSERQFLALNAAPGVFAAGAPLKVRLLTNSARPVAVSAVCRGVVVGQELVSPAVFQRDSTAGGPEVVVPVTDIAEGVIRLTAYDYGVQPPTPVAERLVFRRPVRKLSIQPSQDASRHQPGDSVQLAFAVQDERGRALAAVLGASVVDEAALSLVLDRSASLTTHFWLTGQIDDVRGLEDANLYLAEGSQAEQALDLLLGTQGWRRFVSLPVDQLAQSPIATQTGQPYFADLDSADTAVAVVSDSPVVLADNAAETAEVVRSGFGSVQTAYEQTVRWVGRILIVGSLTLTVMLGLLAVMRRLPARTVWVPALGTSAMCLVLGAAWFVTESPRTQEIAKVSMARAATEVQVAPMEERIAASRLEAAAPASEPELAKADAGASNRWYQVENKVGKGVGLADERPPAAKAAPAADAPGMTADRFKSLHPAEEAEDRKDFDRARFGLQEKQRFDEAGGLTSRKRSMLDRVEQVEKRQQDMPVDKAHVQNLDAPQSLARDASPTRGGLAGRAAGAAGGFGEPSRRSKGAETAAPRPASADSTLADMEAVQAPGKPLDAFPTPLAASTAAQPVPAAAPMLPVAAEQEQSQAAPAEVLAASPEKESKPSELRLEMKAEQAAGARPGMATQMASDPAASPDGPASGMGGMGGAGGGMDRASDAFGGAAAASVPRDANASPERKAMEKREHASASPMPALEMMPAHPSETAEGIAEDFAARESLSRSQVPSFPAVEQPIYRLYAQRNLAESGVDERSAPMETVCWEPLLLTDAQGRATLQFRLPDTATTYRVLIDGHAQGRIGSYLGRIAVKPETASGAK